MRFDIATGDFLTLKQSMSQTKFKIKMKVGMVLQMRMPGNQNAIFQRNHIFFHKLVKKKLYLQLFLKHRPEHFV